MQSVDDEYEMFVGGIEEKELCSRCHDYPCHCIADAIAAEEEPECRCYCMGDRADASDCPLHGM